MLIIYGLIGLRYKQVYLGDVFFFCRLFPLLFVFGFYLDTINTDSLHATGVLNVFLQVGNALSNPSIDVLLAVLLFFIMHSFSSFESVLLLVFAFIGQYYMLHSMDLMTFYIALEAQNFCFLVLCGLPGVSGRNSCFNVEASLKYFLLSAFSSGVILFWFSAIYLQTGLSVLSFKSIHADYDTSLHSFQILCAMMFKLGAAPLHL
jgi:NADH:ubiquinone oxidoreductase subunit 2 (subunit N)